jgi:hypothetical protein
MKAVGTFFASISTEARWVAVLTVLYAVFAFWGLGDAEFWGDEGIGALGSKRVLHFGYPKAWDGENLFSYEAGHDLRPWPLDSTNLVQRRSPWLTFYLGAVGMAIFGENHFGVRFLFALSGVLNLPLLYWVGRRLGISRKAALMSVIVLASLPAHWLYLRQAYHYATDITLTLLAIAAYARIEKRWNPLLLALCVVATFHLNNMTALWQAAAFVALAFWDGKVRDLVRRPVTWLALVLTLIGTWGWLHWSFAPENESTLGGVAGFLPHLKRLGLVLSELDMSFPLLFSLPLLAWCGYVARRDEAARRVFRLAVCFGVTLLVLGGHQYGWLRYFLAIFGILAWAWGAFLVWVWDRNRVVGIALAVVVLLTTLPYQISHAVIGKKWSEFSRFQMQRLPNEPGTSAVVRRLKSLVSPMLREVPSELAAPPVTSLQEVIHYLNRHTRPGEKIYTVCDQEILQFSTQLITVYLVDPRQTTYAKVRHLPGYVTSWREADWLLLHRGWKRNFGMLELEDADQNREVLEGIRKSGATLEYIPLRVRESLPNQQPNLWGHIWQTEVGAPTLGLFRVKALPGRQRANGNYRLR